MLNVKNIGTPLTSKTEQTYNCFFMPKIGINIINFFVFSILICASIFWRSDFEGRPIFIVAMWYMIAYGGMIFTLLNIYKAFKNSKKP